jgi:hypothetical protein
MNKKKELTLKLPQVDKITLFIISTLFLRLITLIPIIIDDDEAWFSVSGFSIQNLSESFSVVIDNKPPGTAWFYWMIAQVVEPSHLTRWARFIQVGLLFLSSFFIGKMASSFATNTPYKSTRTNWVAVLLFLVTFGAAGPKMYAVTNESLMAPWIIFSLYLVWPQFIGSDSLKIRAFFSGVALAAAVFIKQTGIFFIGPWILAVSGKKEMILGLLGFSITLLSCTAFVGAEQFWEWVYAYPASILVSARKQVFSSWVEVLPNFIIFIFCLLPFLLATSRAIRISWKNRAQKINQVLLAWLSASFLSILFGKALFLHYFLLAIAPMTLLVIREQSQTLQLHQFWIWISTAYVLSASLAAIPSAGIFWGNDLAYFQRLGTRIQALTSSDSKVFVWGGNVLPLAISGRRSLRGFPNARFASPPYSTPDTFQSFLKQFESETPELVLDLHQRGDNRFNVPLETIPEISKLVKSNYEAWLDPTLPWVVFYLKKREDKAQSFHSLGLCRSRNPAHLFSSQPKSLILFSEVFNHALSSPQNFWNFIRKVNFWDQFFRAHYAKEWMNSACPISKGEPMINSLLQISNLEDFSETVKKSFLDAGYPSPFSIETTHWWASLALVELQPVMTSRYGPILKSVPAKY